MNNIVKDINLKNRTYYFLNAIINIKVFHPNNIKMGEKYGISGDQKLDKNL